MDRRELLGALSLGAAGVTLAACGASESNEGVSSPAVVKKRKRLIMVTTWPKGLPGLGMAAERIAEEVEKLTDGSISIRVQAAGELVPAFQAFDAVRDGTAHMYHGAEYYWKAKSSAFPFFTAVPFGMTAQEIMGWIDFGGGQQLWDELSGQHFGWKL